MFLKSERDAELRGLFSRPAPPVPSLIGADMTVVGDLRGAGEVYIDGEVGGDVIGRSVTIGVGGLVQGAVFAEFVHVAGTVRGRIEAIAVSIARGADIGGTITHYELEIEPGAKIGARRPWRPLSYLEQNRKW